MMQLHKMLPALLLTAAIARADSSLPTAQSSPAEVREVFDVTWYSDGETRSAPELQHWGAVAPQRGARYLLVDDRGVAGVIEAEGRPAVGRCYDDCPRVRAAARWVEPPHREVVGERVAIGPLPSSGAWAKARLLPITDGTIADAAGWLPALRIDLDGDGKCDLETRYRVGPPGRTGYYRTRLRAPGGWRVIEEHTVRSVFDVLRGEDPLK